jgi:hypothetical protein
MYGYGYKINSGLVVGAGGGGGGFPNTYSLDFDGVDDYIDLSNADDLNFANDFTLSIWVKTSAIGSNQFVIDKSTSASVGNGYSLRVLNTGKVRFWSYSANNSLNSTTTLSADTWYHIAATHDRSGAVNKIYINGALDVSGASGTFNATSNNLRIGTSAVLGNPFGGNLDEASFYDSELSASDILTIYNSGQPTDLSLLSIPPVAWFRMGDNGSYKSPQWLLPNNENKDKVSNYSFEFDGVDTSIQIAPLDIDTTNDLTLSCWVKSNGFTTWDYLVTNGSTGGTNSLLNLRFSAGGALFSLRFGSSVYTGLNGFADGNWHHIAMTINYANGDVKFYKDGVVSSTVLTWGSVGTIARIASIGAINSAGSGSMSGSVDDFAVFQGLQNIADLYNSGEPTTLPSGAVAHWRMGEEATFSTNWTVLDQVGSNDGTSANMTIEDRVGEAPNSTSNSVSYNMDEVDRVEDTP